MKKRFIKYFMFILLLYKNFSFSSNTVKKSLNTFTKLLSQKGGPQIPNQKFFNPLSSYISTGESTQNLGNINLSENIKTNLNILPTTQEKKLNFQKLGLNSSAEQISILPENQNNLNLIQDGYGKTSLDSNLIENFSGIKSFSDNLLLNQKLGVFGISANIPSKTEGSEITVPQENQNQLENLISYAQHNPLSNFFMPKNKSLSSGTGEKKIELKEYSDKMQNDIISLEKSAQDIIEVSEKLEKTIAPKNENFKKIIDKLVEEISYKESEIKEIKDQKENFYKNLTEAKENLSSELSDLNINKDSIKEKIKNKENEIILLDNNLLELKNNLKDLKELIGLTENLENFDSEHKNNLENFNNLPGSRENFNEKNIKEEIEFYKEKLKNDLNYNETLSLEKRENSLNKAKLKSEEFLANQQKLQEKLLNLQDKSLNLEKIKTLKEQKDSLIEFASENKQISESKKNIEAEKEFFLKIELETKNLEEKNNGFREELNNKEIEVLNLENKIKKDIKFLDVNQISDSTGRVIESKNLLNQYLNSFDETYKDLENFIQNSKILENLERIKNAYISMSSKTEEVLKTINIENK